MRGDYRRHTAFGDLLAYQLFCELTHDGVEPVEGFIAEQIARTARKPEQNIHLTLHSLGKCGKRALALHPEHLAEIFIPPGIKSVIYRAIEAHHIVGICPRELVFVIRNIENFLFNCVVFENGSAVKEYLAAVRLEYACHNAQQGAFSGAVASDESVDGAASYSGAHIAKREHLVI